MWWCGFFRGGQAGYGVYWGEGDRRNLSARVWGPQTNSRAELMAALMALRQVEPFQSVKYSRNPLQSDPFCNLHLIILCLFLICEFLCSWKVKSWFSKRGDLKAAQYRVKKLLIISDSEYVVNTATKFLAAYKQNNWRRTDGSPVAHLDLILEIDQILSNSKLQVSFFQLKCPNIIKLSQSDWSGCFQSRSCRYVASTGVHVFSAAFISFVGRMGSCRGT